MTASTLVESPSQIVARIWTRIKSPFGRIEQMQLRRRQCERYYVAACPHSLFMMPTEHVVAFEPIESAPCSTTTPIQVLFHQNMACWMHSRRRCSSAHLLSEAWRVATLLDLHLAVRPQRVGALTACRLAFLGSCKLHGWACASLWHQLMKLIRLRIACVKVSKVSNIMFTTRRLVRTLREGRLMQLHLKQCCRLCTIDLHKQEREATL
jgi:hypothetical protein